MCVKKSVAELNYFTQLNSTSLAATPWYHGRRRISDDDCLDYYHLESFQLVFWMKIIFVRIKMRTKDAKKKESRASNFDDAKTLPPLIQA